MYCVIVGGGNIAQSLASALRMNKHRVCIIERDPEVASSIVRDLNTVVINGDGTDIQSLIDAEADSADVLVALTQRDQDNLVACQLASQRFGVPRTIARVSNPKNMELFERLGGVSVALSTASLVSRLIEEKLSLEDVITLLTFEEHDVAIVQTEIGEESAARGKLIMDLTLPEECVIVAVVRGQDVIFPRGNTAVRVGDRVLALTTNENRAALQEVF